MDFTADFHSLLKLGCRIQASTNRISPNSNRFVCKKTTKVGRN